MCTFNIEGRKLGRKIVFCQNWKKTKIQDIVLLIKIGKFSREFINYYNLGFFLKIGPEMLIRGNLFNIIIEELMFGKLGWRVYGLGGTVLLTVGPVLTMCSCFSDASRHISTSHFSSNTSEKDIFPSPVTNDQ